jgi:predicted ATP-grasp superfamily ATP-dependent carboligase
MMIAHTSTPVVVLASPHHGGLGITRSLGRLGIPVFGVDSTRWAPALFSRYCRGRFLWDLDNAPPGKSVEFLMDIARKLGRRPILIPATDSAAMFVTDHAAALGQEYLFPAQSRTLVHSLCSKKAMHYLAGKCNVPAPKTVFPQTRSHLLDCLQTMELPIMIKGIDSQLRKPNSKTKSVIRSERDLLQLRALIGDAAVRHLVVQEYIPGMEGTVWMFNGYFNEHSECLVGFTGRKLRQCPVYTGVTSLGICQKNAVVEETATRFMKAVGYRGLVDMDFCYDDRDGRYKVLDINPRIGSTFRLFVSNDGMDVARALYLDLTRQPVTPARTTDGRKWIVEDFDVAAAFSYGLDGKLTIQKWLKSLRGIEESAFFSANDPLPMLLMLRADLSELLDRVKGRRQRVPPFEYRADAAALASLSDDEKVCI